MIAKGSQLKDRYRLDRLLGRGGMASVWLASDQVLERPVAVKVLSDTIASDPEFLARFRREARIAASLSHPNLAGVYDYADGEERPYLVMEYIPGNNLAERISQSAGIDCERLARELLGALAHIHGVGVVHRDIKPQNVLIAPDGSAKLIDFGIALPKDATSLTRTGHLLGTARFIAPEVMSGKSATEQSDLYSCGVLLRDCLEDDPAGRLHTLAESLSTADPGNRPASAAEALAHLDQGVVVADQPTEAFAPTEVLVPTEEISPQPTSNQAEESRAVPTRDVAKPSRRRLTWGRAGVALLICGVLIGAFLVFTDGSEKLGGKSKPTPSGDSSAAASGSKESKTASPSSNPATAAAPVDAPEPTGSGPGRGSALNQEGFELIQAGRYEEAIPVLEEAIEAFPSGTDDLNYAYALFNLGNALRLSGRPEEAIPVLESRLEIPNQTGIVRRELAAARSAASP